MPHRTVGHEFPDTHTRTVLLTPWIFSWPPSRRQSPVGRPSALAPGSAMESLAPVRIAANMRRFAEHGIDHRNPEHVAAYLLARQTTTRPRPEQILAILNSGKTVSEAGFELRSDYFLVPKGNLNDQEAEALGRYVISEKQLRQTCAVPAETNLSMVWIVDASCPREHLGPGTKKMYFRELWVFRGRTVCQERGGSGERVDRRTWRLSTLRPNLVDVSSLFADNARHSFDR